MPSIILMPCKGPYGYKNIITPEGKSDIIVEDYAAGIVCKAYELYATGAYSMATLREKLKNDHGIAWSQGYIFRVAKITPTKIGQFVTFWKRIGDGPIMPYDMNDSFDLLVVSVRNVQQFGQFVFPKRVLWQKGLVSKEGNGVNRAMRVYPKIDNCRTNVVGRCEQCGTKINKTISPQKMDEYKKTFAIQAVHEKDLRESFKDKIEYHNNLVLQLEK